MVDNGPESQSILRTAARWGIYPLSWIVALLMLSQAAAGVIEPRQAWLMTIAGLIVFYMVMERLIPYQRRWSMTWRSFLADLKYVVVGGATMSVVSTGLGLFAITISGQLSGPATDWPFWLQIPAIFLIFEGIQYTLHRAMHEANGKFGRFLWMSHVAHHLPDRVYIVMHAASHPINQFLLQAFVRIIPIWFMGYDPFVVAVFLTINGMHGIISHFNVDVRIGFLNYIFIGPELHRYHHSANRDEAKNYGNTLSVYDVLLGTFIYRPGVAPKELGVSTEEGLPPYRSYIEVFKLPFVTPKPATSVDAQPQSSAG
ncbi:MAG: sterol desaturase family protein [Rhodospirillales bacterium]|nr:sterol desaturase family protein [Rhodospirillales bacterium]